MAKVLCMQVGQNIIRLAEVNVAGKKATILKTYTFDVPEDASKDGKIRVSDEVVTAIQAGLIESEITAKDVYFTVESTRILFKPVEIPYVSKNMIQSTLELSFSDLFNVDDSLYHISYVLRGQLVKNEQKMLALEVFAVPNDISESFYNLAVALGLNPKSVSDTSHSIMTLLYDEFQNRNVATVNVEESTSSLAIIVNGEMVFNKTIAQGILPAIETVKHYASLQGGNLNYTEGLEQLYTNNILLEKLPDALLSKSEDAATRFEATQSLSKLIKTIESTFTQYLQKENIQIQEFVVTGLGSGVANISKLMSREFGIPVKVIQQGKMLSVNKNIASEVLLVSAFPLAGAINDGTNFFTANEKAGGNVAKQKQIDKTVAIVGSIIMIAGCAYGAYSWISANNNFTQEKSENTRLQRHVDELSALGVEAKYAAFTTAYSYHEEINNLYLETESINSDMTVFLSELENNTPKGAVVNNIKLTPANAEVTFICENRYVAAGTLHLLRNMQTINSMDCRGVGEDEDAGTVTFTCTFTLKTGEELQGLMTEEETDESTDEYMNEYTEDVTDLPAEDNPVVDTEILDEVDNNAPIVIEDETIEIDEYTPEETTTDTTEGGVE